MLNLTSISNKNEIIILLIVLFIFVIFIFNNTNNTKITHCGCNKNYKKNPYIITN